ncbi:hypothetical protein [Fulvivirga lutimaris]|uniref:hypothetical protein n=1 Tax=Fulvivirga lutimaris TaxID=1819566 RepID=UPI0012BC6413|nr:hypothetical protein [Fulvivirga lutimaris]MTI41269.1 hypothetical protein [Fulvivirga lutimaris]
MNKTLANNRNLLKKKRGFDILKENFSRSKKVRIYKYKKASKQYLTDLGEKVRHQGKVRRVKIVIAIILIFSLIGFGFYSIMQQPVESQIEKVAKAKYFTTKTYAIEKSMILKVDYFSHGQKAVETKYLNGLKHQNSESWYPSGEQFRSAVYWKDTLINEVYFYPNGDTLKNFTSTYTDSVNYVRLIDRKNNKIYSFYFSDGQILPTGYFVK